MTLLNIVEILAASVGLNATIVTARQAASRAYSISPWARWFIQCFLKWRMATSFVSDVAVLEYPKKLTVTSVLWVHSAQVLLPGL
jgi:hypothetical protein